MVIIIFKCWKSRVRDAYGVESVSRGCTTTHEQIPLICNKNSNQKKRQTGQFNIECCTGDYCNNGSFPELAPLNIESKYPLLYLFIYY